MSSTALLGGGIVVGLSLLTDPHKTVTYAVSALTIGGATYLAKRITANVSKEASDIIGLTGWCLAGVPLLGMLKLSLGGLYEIRDSFEKFNQNMQSIKDGFSSFSQWLDKISFWN